MRPQPVDDVWVPAEGGKVALQPPPDAEPGTVGALEVVRARTTGGPEQRSFWKPSPLELAILANDGYVMLAVCSGSHPPVLVGAFDPHTSEPGKIEGFMCGCGGKVFRPFGVDDLMCTACGTMFTTREDDEGDQVLAGVAAGGIATVVPDCAVPTSSYDGPVLSPTGDETEDGSAYVAPHEHDASCLVDGKFADGADGESVESPGGWSGL